MKKFLFSALLISLIGCQNPQNSSSAGLKTILIASEGEVEAVPDMATFNINVSCLDKSVSVSKKCLVDKSNEIHAKLESFGIDKKDILTSAINMIKSSKWDAGRSVFEGYRSSVSINITTRNMDKLPEIYSELLENSNLELRGLNYTHSKMDSLKNEAYIKALQKAGTLADKLLEKLPETEKEVLKIGNIQFEATSVISEEMDSNYVRGNPYKKNYEFIAIGSGELKVNATLFIEYQIK